MLLVVVLGGKMAKFRYLQPAGPWLGYMSVPPARKSSSWNGSSVVVGVVSCGTVWLFQSAQMASAGRDRKKVWNLSGGGGGGASAAGCRGAGSQWLITRGRLVGCLEMSSPDG